MMRISDSSCESSDSGDPEEDRLSVDTDELRTYDNQKVMFVPCTRSIQEFSIILYGNAAINYTEQFKNLTAFDTLSTHVHCFYRIRII